MEPIEKLQSELVAVKRDLSFITKTKYVGVKYDYQRGEAYGEEVNFNQYSDPDKARSLLRRIQVLEDKIYNYEKYIEAERQIATLSKEKSKLDEEISVSNKAVELYNQALQEYQQKNVFQKIGAVISKKKPKNNLDHNAVMQQYGAEAVSEVFFEGVNAQIADIEEAKRQIIEYGKKNPGIEDFVEYNLRQYDQQIADIRRNFAQKQEQIGRAK